MYKTHNVGALDSMSHVTLQKKFLIVFIAIIVMHASYLFLTLNALDEMFANSARDAHSLHQETIQPLKYDPLFYIPSSTMRVWNERDFLIVLGIPSLDIPKRKWRRHMQRTTCWHFPGVATRDNNFTGAMLVLYLLGRHPLNKFSLSDSVVQEADQWHDILVHPINEGVCDTNKIKDDKGYWGYEAEVGSSRKTFLWFQMALLMFPRVPYLAKGDDDIFLRVPQYLADLRRLPKKRIFWGLEMSYDLPPKTDGSKESVLFMSGTCYTMSKDVAEHITSYEPLRKMVWVPYRKERLSEFTMLNMPTEDVMVGRVLHETKYPIIHVIEQAIRYHVVRSYPVTDAILLKHTPRERDYFLYMTYFTLNSTTTPETTIENETPEIYRIKPPEKQIVLTSTGED